ncbi:glycoside hydrolase domain-containing protein [Draconibacterium mangrovi]|uniref:glycoside hydrolase domain-containing protein n=1 Tax=Draconibacterium mangrovi TaxID=2697469 RepID=UPI001954C091|nr:glycoside hydrolase domain-containing protein [Draconibacterium mangrovi]
MRRIAFLQMMIIGILLVSSCSSEETKQDIPKTDTKELINSVNVFLGTSGDHGQMSPSASYPFSMLSIGPVTSPHTHTGYEYYAKKYEGFVHTHLEGVGCTGSGGNILIKPILASNIQTELIKQKQHGEPGYYEVLFENGIKSEMTVAHNFGLHKYHFPQNNNGLFVDLSYALSGRFVDEEHHIAENTVSGWIDTKTTCSRGIYRIYYYLEIPECQSIVEAGEHQLLIEGNNTSDLLVYVGFSSVNTDYAKERIQKNSFQQFRLSAAAQWNRLLTRIQVTGEEDRVDLFYSLLYRGLQAPYLVSEEDGTYRAIDGSVQHTADAIYNGWAIWDNYREQLPMLSLFYPDQYADIAKSIANLYPYGKDNWATKHEPSPTVRTEHAMVVLLDAWKKGYDVPLNEIKEYLLKEAESLDYGSPDKALESSYDCWALSEILKITGDEKLSEKYRQKAMEYKQYWLKDFADLTKNDIDRMQARGLYQGTIWQYRWFVPFDVEGLKELAGGEEAFLKQLDRFFEENNYNHANQPDLQVPGLYNTTKEPWKSQKLFRELLLDTVVQCYFNNNSKGVDPYIGRIYKNQPRAYLRTMDDDAGTMSSWFVLRSLGLSAANVGEPVYYLTAPVFKSVKLDWESGKTFTISVENYNKDHFYIKSVELNGETLSRNWLTHQEIVAGGELVIRTSDVPNKKWGI